MKIRIATDDDAPRIRELVNPHIDMNWSAVYPYWLVCEREGIVGCINVCMSKPIGVLDQLGVDPELGPHARAKVVRELIMQGQATLRKAGAEASISLIPFSQRSYKRALKKHFGAEVVGQGNIVMARL